MNLQDWLELGLRITAIAQLGIAVLGLAIIRMLNWKPELERVSLLVREVFYIHAYFIALTCTIFGIVTWRFAGELAAGTNLLGGWLVAGVGIFWAIRSALQWLYYSSSHWRGNSQRTVIHWVLFLGYVSFAGCYLAAATRTFL